MTELVGWLIVAALAFAVLRLIWPFIVLGLAAYIATKLRLAGTSLSAGTRTCCPPPPAMPSAPEPTRNTPRCCAVIRPASTVIIRCHLGRYNPTLWVCNRPLKQIYPGVHRTG